VKSIVQKFVEDLRKDPGEALERWDARVVQYFALYDSNADLLGGVVNLEVTDPDSGITYSFLLLDTDHAIPVGWKETALILDALEAAGKV